MRAVYHLQLHLLQSFAYWQWEVQQFKVYDFSARCLRSQVTQFLKPTEERKWKMRKTLEGWFVSKVFAPRLFVCTVAVGRGGGLGRSRATLCPRMGWEGRAGGREEVQRSAADQSRWRAPLSLAWDRRVVAGLQALLQRSGECVEVGGRCDKCWRSLPLMLAKLW